MDTSIVSLEGEGDRWELVHRLLARKFRERDVFVSFNIGGKNSYSRSEILALANDDPNARRQLANLLHQMPTGARLEMTAKQLWKAYENIFIAGEVAPQSFSQIQAEISDPETLRWKQAFDKFELRYQEVESLLLRALVDNEAEERIFALQGQLRKIRKEWTSEGYKVQIEELYNQQMSRGEFSFAYQWGKWREAAEDAWELAGPTQASSYGSFDVDFQDILDDLSGWTQITFDHASITIAANTSSISQEFTDPSEVRGGVEKLKLSYKRVSINRDWFSEQVFTSNFWRWVDKYSGGMVSDGNLSGSIPSYTTEILFVKDIQIRERSNIVFDLFEWIGGGFTDLPYKNFISIGDSTYYLLGMVCRKTPLCPNPSREFFNDETVEYEQGA